MECLFYGTILLIYFMKIGYVVFIFFPRLHTNKLTSYWIMKVLLSVMFCQIMLHPMLLKLQNFVYQWTLFSTLWIFKMKIHINLIWNLLSFHFLQSMIPGFLGYEMYFCSISMTGFIPLNTVKVTFLEMQKIKRLFHSKHMRV